MAAAIIRLSPAFFKRIFFMFRAALTLLSVLLLSTTSLAQAQTMPSAATPPVAAKKPNVVEKFGDKRVDDYFWLRDKSSPEVVSYLNAENAYTETFLGPMKDFQETLYKDMLSRIKETEENVPSRLAASWY